MRVPAVESYPTRSTDHHACAGHRDLADWLAHLRLKNRADRTLDDYERTIAALLLWRDVPVAEYTLEDLEHFVLLKYGTGPGAPRPWLPEYLRMERQLLALQERAGEAMRALAAAGVRPDLVDDLAAILPVPS